MTADVDISTVGGCELRWHRVGIGEVSEDLMKLVILSGKLENINGGNTFGIQTNLGNLARYKLSE